MRLLVAGLLIALAASGAQGREAANRARPSPSPGWKPLVITYARHGETVANATGTYNTTNMNVFSVKGAEQVTALTAALKELPPFDVIGVSPVTRAVNSAAPYLKETTAVGELWPTLVECCHQKDHTSDPQATLPTGKPVVLPAGLEKQFSIRADDPRWYAPDTWWQGVLQLKLLVRQLKERYGGSGKRVLLVSHGIVGSLLIEMLCGREPKVSLRLDNGKLSVLEEAPDGNFRLIQLNGRPQK